MDLSGHEGDIIPIQMTNPYVVHGHGHSNSSRPPPPPPPTTLSATNNMTDDQQQQQQQQQEQVAVVVSSSSKKIVAAAKPVKYRECLKNHAASMGGNATDGCGEFMPGGEEGTLESFRCSACGCHRNFHRKEVEGAEPNPSCLDAAAAAYYHHHLKARPTVTYGGYVPRPTAALPPPPAALIMPLGVAMHTSESDEVEETGYDGGGVMAAAGRGAAQAPTARKRFRTKFTQEQKEKMLVFADRVDWRLQRQEEGLVQHFCQEVGVKRRVLKVWMHNNKHNFAKKTTTALQLHHHQQ